MLFIDSFIGSFVVVKKRYISVPEKDKKFI